MHQLLSAFDQKPCSQGQDVHRPQTTSNYIFLAPVHFVESRCYNVQHRNDFSILSLFSRARRQQQLLQEITVACEYADNIGLQVNAGQGLNRQNLYDIASLQYIRELNIGHAIIADSIFMGIEKAVSEYKKLMREARVL